MNNKQKTMKKYLLMFVDKHEQMCLLLIIKQAIVHESISSTSIKLLDLTMLFPV